MAIPEMIEKTTRDQKVHPNPVGVERGLLDISFLSQLLRTADKWQSGANARASSSPSASHKPWFVK